MKTLIETDRLILREIVVSDKHELFAMDSNLEVQKYTGDVIPKSVDEIEERIHKISLSDYQKYGFGRWATILKETNELIGWAGLKYLPEFDEVDLGYRFLPEHWGKGYGTEASKAVIDYGFVTLNLNRIIAIAEPEHMASIRIMEKVGMKHYKNAPYEEGGLDAVWFEILNSNQS